MKRISPTKPVHWMRKTVRATTAKAKNRKVPLQARREDASPLSRADVERLRRMLLAKRIDLESDIGDIEDEVLIANRRSDGGCPSRRPARRINPDNNDYKREFTLGLLENEWALLREINEALKLIREGKYGLCQATGKPIGRARLTAKPWARYCIECALMREKRSSRRGNRRWW